MLRRIVVAACLVGLLAALSHGLNGRTPAIVAHNGVSPIEFGPKIKRGERVCAPLARVDGGQAADALQVTIGSFGAAPPPVRMTVSKDGARFTRVFSNYTEGVVSIPLPAGAERGGTRACVQNLGSVQIVLAGQRTPDGEGSTIDGEPSSSALSMRLVSARPPKWSAVAGSVVERIGFARGDSGNDDSGYAVLALFASAFLVALAAAWRWAR